jgi:hypothetical protein
LLYYSTSPFENALYESKELQNSGNSNTAILLVKGIALALNGLIKLFFQVWEGNALVARLKNN